MSRTTTLLTIIVATGLTTALLWSPHTAHAVTGWDWWDAIYAQQNHSNLCPDDPPSKSDWETALGSADKPDYTELLVFFIAYPCGGTPSHFIDFRDWLNYEIHDVGTWDPDWQYEKFYGLKDLVYEVDEHTDGYFKDGPWG